MNTKPNIKKENTTTDENSNASASLQEWAVTMENKLAAVGFNIDNEHLDSIFNTDWFLEEVDNNALHDNQKLPVETNLKAHEGKRKNKKHHEKAIPPIYSSFLDTRNNTLCEENNQIGNSLSSLKTVVAKKVSLDLPDVHSPRSYESLPSTSFLNTSIASTTAYTTYDSDLNTSRLSNINLIETIKDNEPIIMIKDIIKRLLYHRMNLSYFFCYYKNKPRTYQNHPFILDKLASICFDFGQECHDKVLDFQEYDIDNNKPVEAFLDHSISDEIALTKAQKANYIHIKEYNIRLLQKFNRHLPDEIFRKFRRALQEVLGRSYMPIYYFDMFYSIFKDLYKVSAFFDNNLDKRIQQHFKMPEFLKTNNIADNIQKDTHYIFFWAFYWMYYIFNFELHQLICTGYIYNNTKIIKASQDFIVQSCILIYSYTDFKKSNSNQNYDFNKQWMANTYSLVICNGDKKTSPLQDAIVKIQKIIKDVFEPKLIKSAGNCGKAVLRTCKENLELINHLSPACDLLVEIFLLIGTNAYDKTVNENGSNFDNI